MSCEAMFERRLCKKLLINFFKRLTKHIRKEIGLQLNCGGLKATYYTAWLTIGCSTLPFYFLNTTKKTSNLQVVRSQYNINDNQSNWISRSVIKMQDITCP